MTVQSSSIIKYRTSHEIYTQLMFNYTDVIMSAMASKTTSLNRLFRRGSQKTSKLRVTGLYEGNTPVTGEFPAQRASNAENVSIWWRHHVDTLCCGAIAGEFTHILQGFYSLRRRRFICIWFPVINLRRSWDCLRFIMGFPIPVRLCLF